MNLDFRVLRCLIGGADAGELGDLAFSRLLVETLGVACLGHLEREVDEDLDKSERLVVGVGSGLGSMKLTGLLAVGLVGRDEGGDGDGGAVREELGDLWALGSAIACFNGRSRNRAHLCYPPDVLIPALLIEAQVFVEAEAHVVAIETVCCEAEVEQVLLKRSGDGRLARGGQASEPNGEAALLAECVALAAGERRVPGDVAAGREFMLRWEMAGYGGAHVAIVCVMLDVWVEKN